MCSRFSAQSSKSDDSGEPAANLRKEISQLKTVVNRLQSRQGNGENKGSRRSDSGGSSQVEKQQPASSSGDPAIQELTRFKKTEQLKFKTEGPNPKALCTFFQRNACTRNNCRFAHLCWRCHKPGHGIVDCTAPAKKK